MNLNEQTEHDPSRGSPPGSSHDAPAGGHTEKHDHDHDHHHDHDHDHHHDHDHDHDHHHDHDHGQASSGRPPLRGKALKGPLPDPSDLSEQKIAESIRRRQSKCSA